MKLKTVVAVGLVVFASIVAPARAETRRIEPLDPALIRAAAARMKKLVDANVQKLLATKECVDCVLVSADLAGLDLSGASLSKADLRSANLRGTDLTGADLRLARLSGAKVNDSTQLDPKWRMVWEISNLPQNGRDLSGIDLSNAVIEAAELENVNLSGADLSNSHIFLSNLAKANLSGASLESTSFSQVDLGEANLSNANLTNASGHEVNLKKSNFSHANLTGISLQAGSLADVNMRGIKTGKGTSISFHGWESCGLIMPDGTVFKDGCE